MGAYLSCPITELLSEDGESLELVYGSASMQGWRVSQEDAHIALVDYDRNTSLFGVFDGHGGHEVALYCAKHLPDFIKSLTSYKNNNMIEALEEAFLKFDSTLIKPEVVNELKILAGTEELDKEIDDEDLNEAILLREEADIPIADLMARYNSKTTFNDETEVECTSSSSIKMRIPLPSHMRSEMSAQNSQKPLSPYLRAKRNRNKEANHENEGNSEICSSSSGSSSSTSTKTSEDVSNSEANSGSLPDSTNKIDSEMNVTINESISKDNETNECNESKESSSISNGEIVSTNDNKSLISSTDCLPTSSITDREGLTNDDNQITTSDNKNNNKSENNSSNCVTNADTSNIDEQTSGLVSDKGKGKQKKIITPKRVSTTSTTNLDDDEIAEPIYKSFLDDFDESDDDSNDDFSADLSSDGEDDEELEDDDEESSEDEELDDEDSGLIVQSSGGYEEPGRDSGCTAVVALLQDNKLYVANAGDSRCVLSRNGKAIEMSFDHKPEDDIERSRVEKAGGKVTPDGRVNGGLNLSRAIGDHAYKDNPNISDREQMITALPDVKTITLEFPDDEFMVIACDGIWNSLTSQQVIDFVGERIKKVQKLSTICDDLFKHCLAPNTLGDGTGCDNMTCIIVKFGNTTSKRKLDDDNNQEIESNQKTDVSEESEPNPKRIKTDNCENDSEVTESEIKV